MTDVVQLLKGTVEELDRLLNAKNVLGSPVEKEGAVVIPIVSYGFGFGAGGGTDQKKGPTSCSGAGGGIKPVGAVIIDKDGARVEGVKGATSSLVEALGKAAFHAIERSATEKETGKDPGKD